MSTCAFCPGPLLPTFSDSLPRERCGRCASVWIEGDALTKVMGGSAAEALVRRARGKHGLCKDCQAPLAQVPQCEQCHRPAPTCPRCNIAPLAVTKVHDVEVDVCTTCHGVALDAGELEQLQKLARADREREFDLKPRLEPETLSKSQCAACKRTVKLKHAFTVNDQLYCGSCAPSGSAPYDPTLTRASPSMEESTSVAVMKNVRWSPVDPISSALDWLFSRLGN
ncbi:zf-TFIIB domain-containing protein [Melittangium boletus]|uniref:TFIIB-type zinc ribbon-containing protein n=1 Tax=Melittangium boletus TaxID=83453 RepID=UPI003DA4049F